jgi:hypothetical protein
MDRRTAVGAATVGVVALSLLGMACGGGGASPAPQSSATLQGTYRAHSGPNTLEFRDSTWTLTTGARVFSGKFVVAGNEIVFLLTGSNHPAYEDFCRTDLDVYTWSLDGTDLVLRPLMTTATDRATGRQCDTVADQVFRNGPWTKQG